MTGYDPSAAATAEIRRFHDALVRWFGGHMEAGDFEATFADCLAEGFEWVAPSGRVLARCDLLAGLREGRGANPAFRIRVEEIRLLAATEALVVAQYVEHQSGALQSAPENTRRSTVIFDAGPPLLWRHLHETSME